MFELVFDLNSTTLSRKDLNKYKDCFSSLNFCLCLLWWFAKLCKQNKSDFRIFNDFILIIMEASVQMVYLMYLSWVFLALPEIRGEEEKDYTTSPSFS